jgi:hypothetical protein
MRLTLDEARAQWSLIVQDFCFANLGAHVNAFAMFVTLYCRLLFRGPSPIFVVTANTMRAGKDAWVTIVHITYTGSIKEFGWTGKDEDQKTIFANAIEGATTMHFSNINAATDFTPLERFATAKIIASRVLGKSSTGGVINEILFSLSGNSGFVLGGDMAPRCVCIPLFVPDADPNARVLARASIPAWSESNRLLNLGVAAAALAAWVEAGCPTASGRFNSFPEWFAVPAAVTEFFLGEPLDLGSTAVAADPTTADFNRLLALTLDKNSPFASKDIQDAIPIMPACFTTPELRALAEAIQTKDPEFLSAFPLRHGDDGERNAAQQAFARFFRARVNAFGSNPDSPLPRPPFTLTLTSPVQPRKDRRTYSVRYVEANPST